jgi:HK97 family phage portal protein
VSLLRRSASLTAAQIIQEASGRRVSGTAGQVVTPATSMQLMAVWRCQHLLADLVAGMPVHEFEQNDPDQRPKRVPLSPFVAEPSSFVDRNEWRYQLMLSALGVGNAYPFATAFDPGYRYVQKAEVLSPVDVSVYRSGALAPPVYKVNHQEVDAKLILHMRAFGPTPGSVLGLSPLDYMRQTVGLALAVRAHGASWYEKGGHPTGLLKNENEIDKGDADTARERWAEGVDATGLAVIGKGWDYQSLQVTPEAALFLGATNATAIDICGYFGVPSEMLGYAVSGSNVTYANREQRAIDFLVMTLQWWVGRVERLISRQLPPNRFVKLNVDAILRADLMTRYKAYDLGVRGGWLKQNEPRGWEDLDPLPEGDRAIWPPYSTTPVEPGVDGGAT